ncbi:MAG: hypothetical protein Ta2B_28920 [Termitinemataceae bacterium]|nr:MAG: hypothetical protein Ta2B_28920 [Termitinemataceae bacterium]
MKKIILLTITGLLTASICFAQSLLPENSGFHQEGVASWYGVEFQGRPTASGELFDPNQLTAAHRDLPYGTVLNVTNIMNGRQVQVRINDRGPMNPSRIIDVSSAAADRLDMKATGTAQVSIEIASRASSQPSNSNYQQPQPNNYGNVSGVVPNPFQQPNNPPPPNNNDNFTAQTQTQPNAVAERMAPTTARTPVTPTNPYTNTPNAAPPPNNRLPATTQPSIAPNTAARPPASVPTTNYGATSTNPTPNRATPPVNTPANTAAATGRLPAPTQPSVVPGTPRPAAASGPARALPSSSAPNIPSSQPVTVTNSAARNATTPSYSAIPPTVAPSAPPPPMPTANPNNYVTSAAPPVANVRPTASAASAAHPVTNNPSVTNYPRVAPIPDAQPQSSRPAVTYDMAEIKGGPLRQGKSYRLQVGSYRVAAHAVEAIERLNSVGLSGQYESYGEWYRVVITNVNYDQLQFVAQRIGSAGFKETVAREER